MVFLDLDDEDLSLSQTVDIVQINQVISWLRVPTREHWLMFSSHNTIWVLFRGHQKEERRDSTVTEAMKAAPGLSISYNLLFDY